MLHDFVDNPEVSFVLPTIDFEGDEKFPEGRTSYFDEGYEFDLGGGVKITTVMVTGHTPGSMVFYLEGENIMFSGDAVGSGSGVWIFSLDGYKQYIEGVANLIKFIEAPENGIDKDKLTLYGGHAWQKASNVDKLDCQYIYDMQALIDDIQQAKAEWDPYMVGFPGLNANFKHGTAKITWSTESYQQFCSENGHEVEIAIAE